MALTRPIPVRLNQSQIEWLDAHAEHRSISRSEFIRLCLDRVRSATPAPEKADA